MEKIIKSTETTDRTLTDGHKDTAIKWIECKEHKLADGKTDWLKDLLTNS